ncbi:hypothetical protein FHG87_017624 [Trinorchestia longiramus]|nr:hypothetical protein FHG87_017624 [Trinorchestia longiramus]
MTVLPALTLLLRLLSCTVAATDVFPGLGDLDSSPVVEEDVESPSVSLARSAEVKALGWVMNRMTADYGWGEDTAHTVLAVALANASWILDPSNLEAQLVTKQFELELVIRLWRHHEVPLTTGHLALNVMALVALCRDPRAFHSKDLVGEWQQRASGSSV